MLLAISPKCMGWAIDFHGHYLGGPQHAQLSAKLIRQWSEPTYRHRAFDSIAVGRTRRGIPDKGFSYRIFNATGSEVGGSAVIRGHAVLPALFRTNA